VWAECLIDVVLAIRVLEIKIKNLDKHFSITAQQLSSPFVLGRHLIRNHDAQEIGAV
jgi:hypothetical protein